MSYQLLISKAAQKEFTFIPKEFALALKELILKLKEEPRPAGCKKLKDREGWRTGSVITESYMKLMIIPKSSQSYMLVTEKMFTDKIQHLTLKIGESL